MQLEIAVQDLTGAELAASHGADRIELCCALSLGGLTPSHGLLKSIGSALPELPVHALVRPRPGDYVYDSATIALMVAEIKELHDGGAAGVVIGALTAEDQPDYATVETLVQAAQGLHVTFHRAIDHLSTADAVAAIPQLANLGVQRILTSGGASKAGQGLPQLAAMHEAADGVVNVMAGGGVQLADFASLYQLGLRDVHLSAKRIIDRGLPELPTPAALAEDSSYYATDAVLVEKASKLAHALL